MEDARLIALIWKDDQLQVEKRLHQLERAGRQVGALVQAAQALITPAP